MLVLNLIEIMLKVGKELVDSHNIEINNVTVLIEETGTLDNIEKLQYNNDVKI